MLQLEYGISLPIQPFIHPTFLSIRMFNNLSMAHSFPMFCIDPSTPSSTHSFIPLLVNACIHPIHYSRVHAFIHSFILCTHCTDLWKFDQKVQFNQRCVFVWGGCITVCSFVCVCTIYVEYNEKKMVSIVIEH